MKKMIRKSPLLVVLLTFSLAFLYSGCSKTDDTEAPVITLNGNASMTLNLQQSYVEPGATAVDNNDGNVNVSISGSVDVNTKGVYTITYTATDAAGNSAYEERTVTVVNSADFLGGNYTNAVDTCAATPPSSFNAIVTASNTTNGEFTISNFGAFGSSVVVTCDYNSSTGKITANVPQSLGGGANLTNVFNTSQVVSSSAPTIFKISYQWMDSGGLGDICTSTYTK